jgi:ABC-type nitrate/sulfonate/bicarbonate transport system permease component
VLQQPPPIVVRVVEQPIRQTSIADLILGSLATVAILLLIAAALGLLLGGILIGIKRLLARDGLPTQEERERLRVTPSS